MLLFLTKIIKIKNLHIKKSLSDESDRDFFRSIRINMLQALLQKEGD